ncbi:hypothetical protein ACMC56_10575 [Campylobacterota bacterium DY0563]
MNKPIYLFSSTFIFIICIYLYLFGEQETLNIIKEEYISLSILFILIFVFLFFKLKLKNHEVKNILPSNDTSLKSTIVFFLIFEVMDYYEFDGFLGMASQWFFYWIMGVIFIILMPTINYYLNYKTIKS